MVTLSGVWTFIVILLALALGIVLIYLGFAAIGFALSLPFLIAGAILGLLAAAIGILLGIFKEIVFVVGQRLRLIFVFKAASHSQSRNKKTGHQTYQEDNRQDKQHVQRSQQSSFDPYNILQVAPGANLVAIKTAYHQQMTRYHPDKVAHLGEELQALAEEKAKMIQRAYSALSSH